MAEAWAEMILRVDNGQLFHMRSKDPLEIWMDLRDVHRACGFAMSLALRRKFLTAKKTDDQSMQLWIGQIWSQAFTIKEVTGTKVSDQDKILALTMGLPSFYDPVIINFDTAPPDFLTFNSIVARLLNEETHQGSSSGIKMEHKTILVAKKQVSNWTDVIYYFCNQKGHYKSEC